MSLSPLRTVHFQRQLSCAANLRGAENQVGVSDRVIHVPVGQEHHVKIDRQERFDTFLVSGSRTANHSGAEVNQIGRAVDDDGGGWP